MKFACSISIGAVVAQVEAVSPAAKHVFIENVPAGVCTECGTRYYTANVLKSIEETLHGRRNGKAGRRTAL